MAPYATQEQALFHSAFYTRQISTVPFQPLPPLLSFRPERSGVEEPWHCPASYQLQKIPRLRFAPLGMTRLGGGMTWLETG